MRKWEYKAHQIWTSRTMALSLGALGAALALWATFARPSPGTAIGVLGAVAALMSVRPEMKPLEKAGWLVIITVLVIAEVRAIHRNDEEVACERRVQNEKLASLNEDSQKITADLGVALKKVDTTLKQTQPHSSLKFESLELPPNLVANTPTNFNVHYTNIGNEEATSVITLARFFVGKPDDVETARGFAREFEEAWRQSALKPEKDAIVPTGHPFFTRTFTFDENELDDIRAARRTVYLLVRFQYTDPTGTWRTDECTSVQNNTKYGFAPTVGHPCGAFTNFHYPATPR